MVLQWLLVMCRWLDLNTSFYLGFEHGKAQGPAQVCARLSLFMCKGRGGRGGVTVGWWWGRGSDRARGSNLSHEAHFRARLGSEGDTIMHVSLHTRPLMIWII